MENQVLEMESDEAIWLNDKIKLQNRPKSVT
jgi:hypothetical protein